MDFPTLKERFPFLFPSDLTFWIQPGWSELLERTAIALAVLAEKEGVPVTVVEVKEKFGQMRMYCQCRDRRVLDLAFAITRAAENESRRICEACGGVGRLSSRPGCVKAICTNCGPEFEPVDESMFRL